MKLWAGRFKSEVDKKTNDFNSSISFDSRMIYEDIKGSIFLPCPAFGLIIKTVFIKQHAFDK